MRAVVQVSKASSVSVEGQQVGAIEQGLVVLLGVKKKAIQNRMQNT